MSFRIAADAVVLLHLVFILFAALGGWLALRQPRLAWIHLPALLWGTWIEVSHGICPLTPIENRLRTLAGESGYPGGFIEHYLIPLIYPPGLGMDDQLWLAAGLMAINALAYAMALHRWRRNRVYRSDSIRVNRP